jgi:hypothetical protein
LLSRRSSVEKENMEKDKKAGAKENIIFASAFCCIVSIDSVAQV